MTLADEDTDSILTDNANRAIHGNVAMQTYNLVDDEATNSILTGNPNKAIQGNLPIQPGWKICN